MEARVQGGRIGGQINVKPLSTQFQITKDITPKGDLKVETEVLFSRSWWRQFQKQGAVKEKGFLVSLFFKD